MGEMFYNYSYLKPINHFIAKKSHILWMFGYCQGF